MYFHSLEELIFVNPTIEELSARAKGENGPVSNYYFSHFMDRTGVSENLAETTENIKMAMELLHIMLKYHMDYTMKNWGKCKNGTPRPVLSKWWESPVVTFMTEEEFTASFS